MEFKNRNWFIKMFVCFAMISSMTSCLTSDDNTDGTVKCTFDIGKQNLVETSKEFLPYKNVQNLIFRDSLGVKKVFEVTFSESHSSLNNVFYIKEVNKVVDSIVNCMLSQSWDYKLKEIGGSLLLNARIYNDFDLSTGQKKVLDKVEIQVSEDITSIVGFSAFKMTVDNRTSTAMTSEVITKYDSFEVYDTTYTNVFSSFTTADPRHKAYYNKTEGIVAFTESNGRLWRYDGKN
jgi:hypothetical protein